MIGYDQLLLFWVTKNVECQHSWSLTFYVHNVSGKSQITVHGVIETYQLQKFKDSESHLECIYSIYTGIKELLDERKKKSCVTNTGDPYKLISVHYPFLEFPISGN